MSENWIVPCNAKKFDVIKHFETHDIAVWKNSFTIKVGDTIYLYLSAPYGEIKYRCRVISDQVSEELLADHSYAKVEKASNNYFSKKVKYMVLQKEFLYPEGLLTLEELRKNGLGQVQIQARTDRKVQAFIDLITQKVYREV